MFNKRVQAVIKRELKEKLFSKAFIISTLLIPVFMFGILGLQTFFMTITGDDGTNLLVVAENNEVLEEIQEELSQRDFIKDSTYVVSYENIAENEFQSILDSNKSALLSEKLNALIYIPKNAMKDKEVKYYSKNAGNMAVFEKLRPSFNTAMLNIYFQDTELSKEDLEFARERVGFNGFKVTTDDKVKEEGYGNRVLSYLFTFLLYFSLLMIGSTVMRSVVEEKSNRIVEVLLSSVSPKELMTGKIVGNTIVGVIQMTIWLLPVIFLASSSIFMLPPEFTVDIQIGTIIYLLINFAIGLFTFLGLFATVGAIFDNEQDAQSGMWPIMMLIMIPFFMAFSMINNPNNSMAFFASMAPFASIILMPARMTLIEVPFWQLAVSIIVNLITVALIFIAAGKVYRIGILITGKKPKFKEIIGWLKSDK